MEIQKKAISFEKYINAIDTLTLNQQLDLINALVENVKLNMGKKRLKSYSIMDLEGLGADIWKGIDVKAYVEKERASWD